MAEELGIKTCRTEDLNGYYAKYGHGPTVEENTIYTNPWTFENPSPVNFECASPSTGGWGDHAPFARRGIHYINMEATNWFAAGGDTELDYSGFYETADTNIGDSGMFMNTKYDTLENLEKYFPGRAQEHFKIFSPLLCKLILEG